MKYYKFLTVDNKSPLQQFNWKPYLPKDDRPGKWTPKREVIWCGSGWHVTAADGLREWLNVNLYEAEGRGEPAIKDGDNKLSFPQIRLVHKIETCNIETLQRFALWCAKQVLPIYERYYPDDRRLRDCIKIITRYLHGKATDDEINDACHAAASAARNAATAAFTYASAYAAYSAADAVYATVNANIAYSASYAAAASASAVRNAADAAAAASTYAAAAYSSAYTAYSSAYTATKKVQTRQLLKMLNLEDK